MRSSPSLRCGEIGDREDHVQFLPGQKRHDSSGRPLPRDAHDPLGHAHQGWVAEGHMVEEGSDRRQPRIACPDAVSTAGLEVIQEGEDQVAVEVVDRQTTGRATEAGRGEDKQEPERMPIGHDGLRTGASLGHEAFAKEGLEQACERRGRCLHRSTSPV